VAEDCGEKEVTATPPLHSALPKIASAQVMTM
jgi:hypothetical protein